VLTVLLSGACGVDGTDGYRPTGAQLRELRLMCEEHISSLPPAEPPRLVSDYQVDGVDPEGLPIDPGVCGLVALIEVFGSSCPDLAALTASWQHFYTEGGEPEALCESNPGPAP
jgi:hypothetical protein